ncbi:hypothetical protein IAQ61_012010 [Plenodomus lingam]|uniref:uncharacterized protein n=1 Tax=Leptosphaeria maculans TaxID=5022 RepID=UPI00332467B3|nr:hypothetical protein IAQ61_012010 [Plenodomus lingam]
MPMVVETHDTTHPQVASQEKCAVPSGCHTSSFGGAAASSNPQDDLIRSIGYHAVSQEIPACVDRILAFTTSDTASHEFELELEQWDNLLVLWSKLCYATRLLRTGCSCFGGMRIKSRQVKTRQIPLHTIIPESEQYGISRIHSLPSGCHVYATHVLGWRRHHKCPRRM